MILLNSKAQLTVDVIAKVAERKITIANAAKLFNKSRRTIERYLRRYREMGLQFVVHGNTGGDPANKTPDTVKQQVQALIREKYYDLNLLHLAEMLETNEHIVVKRETLRKWAHDIRKGKNEQFSVYFAGRQLQISEVRQFELGTLIAMEACSTSHFWGRTFSAMGYSVRLIPAQHVKAFVRSQKNTA